MGTITAKQLKQRTGEVIRRVRAGEELIVTYRGKPLALMTPTNGTRIAKKPETLEEVWKDIEESLDKSAPRFRGWKEAMVWARKRTLS